MSLRASAHKNHSHYKFAARSTTGVAIRIPLRILTTKLPKGERIATGDIGHWFAMTALS